MSVKRGRPGSSGVRHGRDVGPDYPETNFRNPWNAGIDAEYNPGDEGKCLSSPTANTIEGGGVPLHGDYDKYWEGK